MITMILDYQVNFVAIIWEEESNLSAMNLFFLPYYGLRAEAAGVSYSFW